MHIPLGEGNTNVRHVSGVHCRLDQGKVDGPVVAGFPLVEGLGTRARFRLLQQRGVLGQMQ